MIYEFACPAGHRVDLARKVSERDEPATCEHVLPDGGHEGTTRFFCGKPLTRLISAPAGYFPGADSWRK